MMYGLKINAKSYHITNIHPYNLPIHSYHSHIHDTLT